MSTSDTPYEDYKRKLGHGVHAPDPKKTQDQLDRLEARVVTLEATIDRLAQEDPPDDPDAD